MGLVTVGLIVGGLLGLVVGWIGGRMAGLGEGAARERRLRRIQAEQNAAAGWSPRVAHLPPEVLKRDSMAASPLPGRRALPVGRRCGGAS